MSTPEFCPYEANSIILSKSETPVSKLDSPTRVPPPIMVPETLSNLPVAGLTLIIDTPLPIETSSLFLLPENKDPKLESLYISLVS
jgi:hypothetical protein